MFPSINWTHAGLWVVTAAETERKAAARSVVVLDVVDKLSSSMASNQVIGEPEQSLVTRSFGMSVQKKFKTGFVSRPRNPLLLLRHLLLQHPLGLPFEKISDPRQSTAVAASP